MILKGEISSVKGTKYEVLIREKNYITSPLIKAEHISELRVNDIVTVGFYNNTLSDGIILAKQEMR